MWVFRMTEFSSECVGSLYLNERHGVREQQCARTGGWDWGRETPGEHWNLAPTASPHPSKWNSLTEFTRIWL